MRALGGGWRDRPISQHPTINIRHPAVGYSRLKVTDATGEELTARLQVASDRPAPATLAVMVNDAEAVYPVRIDPTFSDANWSSMGGMAGADGTVAAAVMDGSGNLYIRGSFDAAGEVIASRVAKWNGSSWSALGSGMSLSYRSEWPGVCQCIQ